MKRRRTSMNMATHRRRLFPIWFVLASLAWSLPSASAQAAGGLRSTVAVTSDSGSSSSTSTATLVSYTKCGVDNPNESPLATHAHAWTMVAKDGSGDFQNLPEAIASGAQNIFIKNGVYNIANSVIIGKKERGLKIRGESREETILKFDGEYSFFVIFDSEEISISKLTLDAKFSNQGSKKMWEVIGIVNSKSVSIVDTIVFASSTMYAIFFAGPSNKYADGQETIDAYNAGDLDYDNTVENCIIYSDNPGDALVFTMQKNGRVNNNKVTRGGISFFMNMDTACNQNTVLDSETYGIFVTVPASNIIVQDNKIIRSKNTGIKVTRQIDHKDGNGKVLTPTSYRANGVRLTGNQIFDTHFMGLEIDQTHNAVITHNSISRTDYSGMFVQNSDHIMISNNRVEDFGISDSREHVIQWNDDHNAGVYGDVGVSGATITNNIIIDFMSHGTRYGIKVANPNPFVENTGCTVSQNIISGDYTHDEISTPPTTIQEDNSIIK